MIFDEERRTKPLRMILQMFANPFTCPLSEWPNEGKRALWQNPDIGLTSGGVHCLRMCSIILDTSRHLGFIILLRKSPGKVPEDVPKKRAASDQRLSLPLGSLAEIHNHLRCTLRTRCTRLVEPLGVGVAVSIYGVTGVFMSC